MKGERAKSTRVALVVLGMHRSGTSAMAGALTLLGCDGPATPMKPTKDNPKGYFEPLPLYPLHSELLASASSSWDDWLPVGASWLKSVRAEEFRARAAEVITGQFGESRLFVLKDPRICRLVPFWSKVLDELKVTPRYILTHRNPLEVAQSLHQRDGMDPELALLVWLRHVLEAEAGTRGRRRCFTSYSELMAGWKRVARKIEDRLKVALPRLSPQIAGEMDEFLSADLRHQTVAPERALGDARTAGWVETVFGILEKWVAKGESASDFASLDRVRQEFDNSAEVYAGPLRALRRARDELRELESQNLRSAGERAALSQEMTALREGHAKAVADLEGRLKDLAAEKTAAVARAQEALKAEHAEKVAQLLDTRERQHAAIQQAREERNRIAAERTVVAARLKETQDGRQRLERELAEARAAAAEQASAAARAEAALAGLQERQTEREAEVEGLLEGLRGELEDQLRLSEAEIRALREDQARISAALEQEKAALAALAEERKAALTEAEAALEALRADHLRQHEALSAEKQGLEAALAALAEERKAALTEAEAALEVLRADHLRQHEALSAEKQALEAALAALAEERKAALTEAEAALEVLRADHLRQHEALSAEKQALEAALADALSRFEALKAESAQAMQDLAQARSGGEAAVAARVAAEEALEGLRRTLDARDAELAQSRSALEQRRHELDQYLQELAALKAELAEERARLQSAEGAAAEREATLSARLADREAVARRLEESLAERNRELAELTQLLVRRDSGEAEARAALVQSEKAAGAREEALIGQVQDREARLRGVELALKEQHREFAQLAQLVVARENERDEAARLAATRAGEIEALQSRASAAEAERDEAARLAATRAGEIAALQSRAATTEAKHDEAARMASRRSEEVLALREKLDAAVADRDAHAAHIAELLSSRSWKLTRPVRALTTVVRAVLGRGRTGGE